MFTNHCNCYVTVLVADNTLKYPHAWKSQNNFGIMNAKTLYGCLVYGLATSLCWKFEFFMIARESANWTSLVFFANNSEKLLNEVII